MRTPLARGVLYSRKILVIVVFLRNGNQILAYFAESTTKGGLLNLTAQDVLEMTDEKHQLFVLGNPGTRCQRVPYLQSDV